MLYEEIATLAVLPRYQKRWKQGVGLALLKVCIAELDRIYLTAGFVQALLADIFMRRLGEKLLERRPQTFQSTEVEIFSIII